MAYNRQLFSPSQNTYNLRSQSHISSSAYCVARSHKDSSPKTHAAAYQQAFPYPPDQQSHARSPMTQDSKAYMTHQLPIPSLAQMSPRKACKYLITYLSRRQRLKDVQIVRTVSHIQLRRAAQQRWGAPAQYKLSPPPWRLDATHGSRAPPFLLPQQRAPHEPFQHSPFRVTPLATSSVDVPPTRCTTSALPPRCPLALGIVNARR
jgi:hypothetical protein